MSADRSRPGPDARVVGHPRVSAAVGWLLLTVAFGAGGVLSLADDGSTAGAVIALAFCAFFVLMLVGTLRQRAWLDGERLVVRTLAGHHAVRLDRLTTARRVESGQAFAWILLLTDADGGHVRVDTVGMDVRPLYRELGVRLNGFDRRTNRALERKLARYR